MQIFRKPELSKKKVIILSVVFVVLAVFCFCQNNILTVDEYEYANKKVPASADGMRIVQISDLHNKEFGRENHRLIEKIEEQHPDIIVITGDIADSSHTDIDAAVTFCEKAAELAPCYYITGNHEMWLDDNEQQKLYSGIENAGVTILDNETVHPADGIAMTGLDDGSLYNGTLEKLTADIDPDELHIVLAHEPQYLEEEYVLSSPDLIITGHAHGGQVRLPFIGGLVAPDQGFLPEYTAGEYKSGDTAMYVSRGLGNSVIPLRVFNYPEINVLIIKVKN